MGPVSDIKLIRTDTLENIYLKKTHYIGKIYIQSKIQIIYKVSSGPGREGFLLGVSSKVCVESSWVCKVLNQGPGCKGLLKFSGSSLGGSSGRAVLDERRVQAKFLKW